ncbi:MAG: glycosyltransferase [Candidatus Rokubacteria bacterium]|nr:glycosyltransferase [Candidatus Rokubacteria bacterium]
MVSRTNVLFFLPAFATGGTERLVADLAAHLDPDRFRVFACSQTGGLVGEALAARGCPVHTIGDPVNGRRPRAMGKLHALRARVARLEALMERDEIDILHTHHLTPLLHAFLAGRRARRWRWVHTEQIRPDVDGGYPRWLVWVGRWLLSRPDLVTGASDAVGAYLLDEAGVSPDRVKVIYNCVDVRRFGQPHDSAAKRRELGLPSDAWVIGLVGNLRPQKNHEGLLRAFAQLRLVVPDAWLVLVGEGERREQLEALAGALTVRDRVRFLGARLDVPELYSVFDVYCLPSHYEGMPLTVFEAMSAGKPVVATRVLGIREVIADGETGLLVPPGDSAALARALLQLRRDGGLGRRLAKAGEDYVNAHARLELMVDRYAALYDQVLAA